MPQQRASCCSSNRKDTSNAILGLVVVCTVSLPITLSISVYILCRSDRVPPYDWANVQYVQYVWSAFRFIRRGSVRKKSVRLTYVIGGRVRHPLAHETIGHFLLRPSSKNRLFQHSSKHRCWCQRHSMLQTGKIRKAGLNSACSTALLCGSQCVLRQIWKNFRFYKKNFSVSSHIGCRIARRCLPYFSCLEHWMSLVGALKFIQVWTWVFFLISFFLRVKNRGDFCLWTRLGGKEPTGSMLALAP